MLIFLVIGDAPAQYTYCGCVFFFCAVLIMLQATNEKLAFLFFDSDLLEGYARYNDPKLSTWYTKTAITRLEKTPTKMACVCLRTRFKYVGGLFFNRNCEIEQGGIAEKPTFLVITCFKYQSRVFATFLDGWQIGQ